MKREVITTKDGSNSIYIPDLDETYHSFYGAIQEAQHVFIREGLQKIKKQKIKVFEVGFGTGLNALLSMGYSQQNSIEIDYSTIESYPVEKELINKLNYLELLGSNFQEEFDFLHSCEWGKKQQIKNNFLFNKIYQKLADYELEKSHYDLIYFDAFGPKIQPAMWSLEILQDMFNGLVSGGVLVTYCAQGQFKRNLKTLGFIVENIPGPPGKREMTCATKP